jgi:putative DNA primase/helicase
MLRRVILCSLDANLERPELRQFRSDPVATVLADRGRYVAAVLTIIRAYLAVGCPDQCQPFASFGDWSRLIRSPLVWLGCPDPVATIETTRAGDPKRGQLGAVVAAWLSTIGPNKPISAGDLVQTSFNGPDMALNKALMAVASFPGRSEVDATRLGKWLGRNRGRIINGYKICNQLDTHSKQQFWWLAAKEAAQ